MPLSRLKGRSVQAAEQVSVFSLLREGTGCLEKAGIGPAQSDCEQILMHALRCGTRSALYLYMEDRELPDGVLEGFRNMLDRRAGREPLQHILGLAGFCGLDLMVDGRAFIPRFETEVLVEEVLKRIPAPAKLLDICTGSGNIAVAIAVEKPGCRVTAVDISPGAIAVAEQNARSYGVSDRINFMCSDVFCLSPLEVGTGFDAVVSNPPYIPTGEIEHLPPEVRKEQSLSLDGGRDGTRFYAAIAGLASSCLAAGGLLAVEIDERMGEEVACLLTSAGTFGDCRVLPDYSGKPRIVTAVKL